MRNYEEPEESPKILESCDLHLSEKYLKSSNIGKVISKSQSNENILTDHCSTKLIIDSEQLKSKFMIEDLNLIGLSKNNSKESQQSMNILENYSCSSLCEPKIMAKKSIDDCYQEKIKLDVTESCLESNWSKEEVSLDTPGQDKPIERENLAKKSDNTRIDPSGGNISSINLSVKVEKTANKEYVVILPKLNSKSLLIPKRSTNFKINSLTIITGALIANDKFLKDASMEVITSIYCGIFNIYLEFLDLPSVCHYLVKHGFRVVEISAEEWTSWMSVQRKGVNQIVARYLNETEDTLVKIAWTILGPFLCLLGHRPKEGNLNFWGYKMLKTFCAATKLSKEKQHFLFFPSSKYCALIAEALDKLYDMKRYLFFVVYNKASSLLSIPAAVCRLVIEHLRGVGLLDFILIDQFLLIQNPFSLLLNRIASHASEILEAYEKYVAYGHLAPWSYIIAVPEDLKVFKNPGIKYIATIARGIGIRKGVKVLENYQPMEETEEIKATVEKALQLLKDKTRHQVDASSSDEGAVREFS